MVYMEKAQECKEAAEDCLQKSKYNSAANRFYYCLFLTARGILEKRDTNNTRLLESNTSGQNTKKAMKKFSHSRIDIELAKHLQYNVKEFVKDWREVYELRLKADYKNQHISKENIDTCRRKFYEIYRRITWTDR